MKEFKDSFNALIDALPEGFTYGNVSWNKAGVNYTISLSNSGGATTASFNAYKLSGPPEPAATIQ